MSMQHNRIDLADGLLIDAEINGDQVQSRPLQILHPAWLIVGMILVGLNLRPALSSIGPILPDLKTALGLSGFAASVLTTLPVLCLGLFAPLAPLLARRFGAERTIFGMLLLLLSGMALRMAWPLAGLYAGSLLAGAAIGVIGVLLPGIVKRDFPQHAGLMTGIYTMALCLGAAIAAGATVPLQHAFGGDWRPALGMWAVPALLAALVWLPQIGQKRNRSGTGSHRITGLWTDRVALQVTIFMGFQSSLAYIVMAWLPSILYERGLSVAASGLLLSAAFMLQLITALLGPWLATRGRDQRFTVALMMAMSLAGLMGMLYAPLGVAWLAAVLLGLGQGGSFSLALTLIVLRSPNAHVTGHLSTMTQGVGYVLAALGPFVAGMIHDATGSWRASGFLFCAIAIVALLAGMGAARNRMVQVRVVDCAAA